MAKIIEDVLVIKFSKIVKDSEEGSPIANPDVQTALEQVAQELVGSGVVVEVVQRQTVRFTSHYSLCPCSCGSMNNMRFTLYVCIV